MRLLKKTKPINLLFTHLISYPSPGNLTYVWSFGSLAGLFLAVQILTGLFISMHYTPSLAEAFSSVEHIMRDVNNGWLLRYAHANGASFFFLVIYPHIWKGIYYKSFYGQKATTWLSGCLIFLLLILTAFLGYVLPWGQMSFWGATVITSLVTAVPLIGTEIVVWLWGGFSVGEATLSRFYSLHYLLPFIILALVLLHLSLLHSVGSGSKLGLPAGSDVVAFYPYFFLKDLLGFVVALFFFFAFILISPNATMHPDNYIEANPMITPTHIVPEWYFLSFYAILRTIPDKLGGVVAMLLAIVALALVPLFAVSFTCSPKFRSHPSLITFWVAFVSFFFLLKNGELPLEEELLFVNKALIGCYFYSLFFYLSATEATELSFSKIASIRFWAA